MPEEFRLYSSLRHPQCLHRRSHGIEEKYWVNPLNDFTRHFKKIPFVLLPRGPKLHKVIVVLAQRDHTHKKQHLEPAVKILRLKANGSQQEVKPLVRQKLTTAYPELSKVKLSEPLPCRSSCVYLCP